MVAKDELGDIEDGKPYSVECVRADFPEQRIYSFRNSDIAIQATQGRDCCDAFLCLSKTCAKLGIVFWNHLAHGSPCQNSAISHTCQRHVTTD